MTSEKMTLSPARTPLRPNLLQRFALGVVLDFFSGVTKAHLTVVLPNGERRIFGAEDTKRRATLTMNNYRMPWKVVKDGGIGFGESYVDGDWSADNLPEVMSIIFERIGMTEERALNKLWPMRLLHRYRHSLRRNTIAGSRQNIHDHYDLGNAFFSRLLDETLTYSSAIFEHGNEPLETAQRRKLATIIQKAQITATDHVLEIGSGWGSFAIQAVQTTGCRVTTVTVSEEQFHFVQQKVAELGLSDKIEVRFCDYRLIEGSFDKVVSIEMMEALGKEYLGTYFGVIEKLLKPDGIAVVQVITMLDQWYAEYCTRVDWIQKYIFPGSHLPSLTALTSAITGNSQLMIEQVENYAPHYAHTLKRWRERLAEISPEIAPLGYDAKFQRTFEYYLAVCEAEFGTRVLGLLQIVLTRANNQRLIEADAKIFGTDRAPTLALAV